MRHTLPGAAAPSRTGGRGVHVEDAGATLLTGYESTRWSVLVRGRAQVFVISAAVDSLEVYGSRSVVIIAVACVCSTCNATAAERATETVMAAIAGCPLLRLLMFHMLGRLVVCPAILSIVLPHEILLLKI